MSTYLGKLVDILSFVDILSASRTLLYNFFHFVLSRQSLWRVEPHHAELLVDVVIRPVANAENVARSIFDQPIFWAENFQRDFFRADLFLRYFGLSSHFFRRVAIWKFFVRERFFDHLEVGQNVSFAERRKREHLGPKNLRQRAIFKVRRWFQWKTRNENRVLSRISR